MPYCEVADRGMTPQQAMALRHAARRTAMDAQEQVVAARVSDTGSDIAPDQQ